MKASDLFQTHQKYFRSAKSIHKNDIFDAVKIIANLVEIFPEILMDNLLGSAGKQEISGDIDIAIEDNIENIADILERNRAIYKINKGLNCINLLIEMKNSQNVQVDLFFGESEWLKFTHFSAGDKSKYKGIYRTVLLSSIISATTDFVDYDNDQLIAKVGPILNLSEGIRTQYRIALAKKNSEGYIKKLVEVKANDETFMDRYGIIKTQHIDINTPNKAAAFIFESNTLNEYSGRKHNNITAEDLGSFEQVHKLMLERIPIKKQQIIQKIFRNRTGKHLRIAESADVEKLQKQIKKAYPRLVKFGLSSPRDAGYDRQSVNIAMIEIHPEYRNTGIGSRVLEDTVSWADQNNIWLTLSVAEKSKGGATSRSRLVKFYKRFGFIENKGRNTDFAISKYADMYRKPKAKINEAQNTQMPWNKNPTIGWWLDNDTITFYHGTHKDNVTSILKNGLFASETGRTAGITYLALDPFTGKGYGSMSGETEFRAAGRKAKHVPMEDRATIVFEFPREYVEQNMSWNNPKLVNRESYEKFVGSDTEYYELSEVQHPGNISAEFIIGYM